MPRVRIFAMLAIAIVAGGTLAYGTYSYVQSAPVKTVSLPTQPVVVAAVDLQLGAAIEQDDVRVVQWPEGTVPEGAVSRPEDAVGRGVLASLVRSELVLEAKLAPRESGAGLPPVIPPGMRAMSVRVNEVIGVAGYVLPGTRVDVIATASPTDRREETTSKLVLPNVQVLAAGTNVEQEADKSKPMQVTVVTLLVTPEQAEKLTLASSEGKIQLALRNPMDQSEPETTGIRPAMLLGLAQKPAPPPAPRRAVREAPKEEPAPAVPAPATVEIIRGDKRANEVVQ